MQKPQQRVVRVFISSTFLDMKEERNKLVKFTFLELRKLCSERQVELVEVDLRWGITDVQVAEGKVLPICLDEIKRCKPFFIGLLGERYGSLPDKVSPELIKREPWLEEHFGKTGKSVTELEILHGVLNNPAMAEHAFFYFRDSDASQKVEDSLKEEEDYLTEPDSYREKLTSLKNRIEASGFPVRKYFIDPEELGELVLKNLWQAIDKKFPKEDVPSALERERMDHDAFAVARQKPYIGREEYYKRLDKHVASEDPPLVVLGKSGVGKSALLANWAKKHHDEHPEDFMVVHFIGGTADSADYVKILRRIMEEIRDRYEPEEKKSARGDIQSFDSRENEIPTDPRIVVEQFPMWLAKAAARGTFILVLDALNQLEDKDNARGLGWLPEHFPPNAHVILSTLPGSSLDILEMRNLPTKSIDLLSGNEREKLIEEYLDQFAKELISDEIKHIRSFPQTANPLYLRALLGELRVYGDHKTLNQRIGNYLKAENIDDLYEKILERYEEDYESKPELEGMVSKAMSLIWASRRGLSETELLELLGKDEDPMPRVYWSPLYLAMKDSLISRSGLLNFSHDYLRKAVKGKYLKDPEQKHEAYVQLSDYFDKKELDDRKAEELPWQLQQVEDWKSLYNLLTDLPFFKRVWDNSEYDLKGYWSKIEKNSLYKMVNAYFPVLKNKKRYIDFVWSIGLLFQATGHSKEALEFSKYLVKYYRFRNKEKYYICLGNYALAIQSKYPIAAMKFLRKQEHYHRKTNNKIGLQAAMSNRANILTEQGYTENAMPLYKQAEQICKDIGYKEGLQFSLGNQANILLSKDHIDSALQLHREKANICKELGNMDQLQNSLGGQSKIYLRLNNLDEAMKLSKEQERISREIGSKNGLQDSFGNRADIHMKRGELKEAMRLYKEKAQICKEIGRKYCLLFALYGQAEIFHRQGNPDGALELLKEQECIAREIGNIDGLQVSLSAQALILSEMTDLREQINNRIEQGDNVDDMLGSLGVQAITLRDNGDLKGSMMFLKEVEHFSEKLGDEKSLQASLGDQALILKKQGNMIGAMEFLKRQQEICVKNDNKEGLQKTLTNQGNIYYVQGKLEEAMRCHKEAEDICRKLDDKNGIQRSLGNQGAILYSTGRLEENMDLLKEQEHICRKIGNKKSLINCLRNQSMVLKSQGKHDEAMKVDKELDKSTCES